MLNQLLKYTPGRAAGPPRDKVLRTSPLNKVLCLDSTQSNTEENNKISVSIDVSNLKQTETFYIESLGCKKLIDQEDISVISAGNCDIYLRAKKKQEQNQYYQKRLNVVTVVIGHLFIWTFLRKVSMTLMKKYFN